MKPFLLIASLLILGFEALRKLKGIVKVLMVLVGIWALLHWRG